MKMQKWLETLYNFFRDVMLQTGLRLWLRAILVSKYDLERFWLQMNPNRLEKPICQFFENSNFRKLHFLKIQIFENYNFEKFEFEIKLFNEQF